MQMRISESRKRAWALAFVTVSWGFAFVVFLYFLVRIFVCDVFPVSTLSMYPTIKPGKRLVVNKLIFGARIYKSLKFPQEDSLKAWRMPGFRGIRNGDVVVFNYPFSRGTDPGIEFNVNIVYVKRCVGGPGDMLAIRDGLYRLLPSGDTVGYVPNQLAYAAVPDSTIAPGVLRSTVFDEGEAQWTTKNLGPLYIPRKGASVMLDTLNYKPYRFVIEYETGRKLEKRADGIYLAGRPLERYTFKENYYFMAGDNVADSHDSRYFGYVPEMFIVGVVSNIDSTDEGV